MPAPSAFEQEMLELLNRARMNPAGEYNALIRGDGGVTSDITAALRYFGVDLASYRAQISNLTAVAPLAWNTALATAARDHTELMIAQDAQSHQLRGELGMVERLIEAGYTGLRSAGENIYAYTKDPVYGHAGFFIDWGFDDEDYRNGTLLSDFRSRGDGIQDPAGHRVNIMSATYTEVGISAIAEHNSSTSVGPWIVTQDFGGRSGYVQQLVGVVIDDRDGDRFYDRGEGMGNVAVTATGNGQSFRTTTWSSGGYQMELPPGTYTVTFAGGGLDGRITRTVTIGTQNVKLDAVAADATSTTTTNPTISAPASGLEGDNVLRAGPTGDRLVARGGNDTLIGGAGDDWLMPGRGNDSIDGAGGRDTISYSDVAARLFLNLEAGIARIGGGNDSIRRVEDVVGTAYADQIQGDGRANLLRGLGGNDIFLGSGGADAIEGGPGRDTVSYAAASARVAIDASAGRGTAGIASGDRYASIEEFIGTRFADHFIGSTRSDTFRGRDGNDTFFDRAGGRDLYDGGLGEDTVSYMDSARGIAVHLGRGTGTAGAATGDTLVSIENLTGSTNNDEITGSSQNNHLRGLRGDDLILGLDGDDRLDGGMGNDRIDGGRGTDTAVFSRDRALYDISTDARGQTTVTYLPGGGDGTDTLTNIEILAFADTLVFL